MEKKWGWEKQQGKALGDQHCQVIVLMLKFGRLMLMLPSGEGRLLAYSKVR